jgi:hypothetical protein
MSGAYAGTAHGCDFQIVVSSGMRQASGHEITRASINAKMRGRPLSGTDFKKPYEEIYLLIGNQHRRDIAVNQGSYSHGRIVARSLKDVVAKMIDTFAPKPAPIVADEGSIDEVAPLSPRPF